MLYSLADKLLGKTLSVQKEVLGMQVEFRILTNQERVEVWRRYPTTDIMTAPEVIAAPTLARAIMSIDGSGWEQFTEIQKLRKDSPNTPIADLVTQHLKDSYPYPVLIELYIAYMDVVTDFQKHLDELKKNSKQMSPELSGESAVSSVKTP